MPIAIVSALPQEQAGLLERLSAARTTRLGGRDFHAGALQGVPVVLVLSGIGKVAAAATTALLCQHFQVRGLLFTGVAGGVGAGVAVGDVVVARSLLQHDLDASPIFPRWEVPGTGRSHFDTDADATAVLQAACAEAVPTRQAHAGLMISGDRFVSSAAESQALQRLLPDALAVDMESAAVAQVAADFSCPLAVLRSISDRADDAAHVDFPQFLAEVAAPLSCAVVQAALPGLAAAWAPLSASGRSG